jgi:hypothetical protein
MTLHGSRSGAALLLVLLLVVVLDCVVIGMLQLAGQQRRIAHNRAALLQLRLAAESVTRRTLIDWPITDSAAPFHSAGSGLGIETRLVLEPLRAHAFLLTASAWRPGSAARFQTTLLVHPPPLPSSADPTSAAIAADIAIVRATADIIVAPGCAALAVPAIRSGALSLDGGARVMGAVAERGSDLRAHFEAVARHLAAAPHRGTVADRDTLIHGTAGGVLLVRGNLSFATGAAFDGLVLALGAVRVEPGARITGAVHSGTADVAGTVESDPCAVETAVHRSGLRRAGPLGSRARVPSF